MKNNKIILAALILSMLTLIFSGCGGGGSVTPPIPDNTNNIDSEEIEPIEVASGEIDLNDGGVVEVTDESSEIYGTRLIIDPINKERSIKERSLAEIAILINQMVLGTNEMVDNQGFLITPVGASSTILEPITGRLEIFYNKDKLSNSGVSKDSSVNVYRVLCTVDPTALVPVPVPSIPWEKVPVEKITHLENMVSIEIGIGDLNYLYTLTVTNCTSPSNLGTPLPGDLVYRLSVWGVNDNWLPGHVGIYVGEKYHEGDGLYNVIEAIGISPNKVVRSYYPDITTFGVGPPTYMGAREPINQFLTHINRNAIVEYVELMVGMPYAIFETIGVYSGWARGDYVKGTDIIGSFNCVGLAEKAYEIAGVNNFNGLVSDVDEGNESDPDDPDAILSPQEQLFRTVPASGIIDQNTAPVISNLAITPEGSIETNSLVYITCNASDSDQDELTYIWTIPEYGNFITFTKGKSISWGTPNKEGTYTISCKIIDNYGGEDSKSIDISVGGSTANHSPDITSTAITSATKGQPYSYDVNATDSDGDSLAYSLTTKPSGMTINSSTGLITWTPNATGSFGVTVKAFDGELFDAQSFTVKVEETSTATPPATPTSLSPGTTSPPGPTISTLTPTLQWQAVPNADYYNLSVSIYPYGTSNIIYYNQQVYGNSITVPSGELEAGKKYRWNMRAHNIAGYSDYSSDYYFQTESLPSSQVERITNSSFSSGTSGWTLVGDFWADTNFSNYHTSPGYAAGGVDSAGLPKNSALGWMYQAVAIPSGATSATLSFWYNITSEETGSTAYDVLNVTIQNSAGNYLATVAVLSNLNKSSLGSYNKVTFDVTSYKGQTIRVHYLASTDSSVYTVFRIDDVSLMSDG